MRRALRACGWGADGVALTAATEGDTDTSSTLGVLAGVEGVERISRAFPCRALALLPASVGPDVKVAREGGGGAVDLIPNLGSTIPHGSKGSPAFF